MQGPRVKGISAEPLGLRIDADMAKLIMIMKMIMIMIMIMRIWDRHRLVEICPLWYCACAFVLCSQGMRRFLMR